MGALVWAGARGVGQLALSGKMHDLVIVVGIIPLGCLLYGALLWGLKIEGREELALIIAKFRGKTAAR
jgi:putative peptidoglycan lipid II flippase